MSPRGLAGLYIHVPFCSAICPYCDFAVQVGKASLRADYVDAVVAEMHLWRDWMVPIDTIYLGGGTPSILNSEELSRMLDAARAALPVSTGARIHLEANPEDVVPDRVDWWRRLGVDYLSLGVQSFNDTELRGLGRRHGSEDSARSVALCLAAGFQTVSVDLIFGLPGQSTTDWRHNLDILADLGPQHVSCYQLTVHEGTTFARWRDRGRLVEMPEDNQAELFELTHRRLADAGFVAYEVSNFARSPDHRSAHNQKYWRHAPYLGLGPSAHSFDGRRRWWNQRALSAYLSQIANEEKPVAGGENLGAGELALETLMLGLRTTDGVDLDRFEKDFDVNLAEHNRDRLAAWQAEGLIQVSSETIRPTIKGLAVADGLSAQLSGLPAV